jgi:hypothetical protein
MKLYGWEKVGSSEEYREMIKAEYHRLKRERTHDSCSAGMEEVKLRLFLSLLDKPRGHVQEDVENSKATGVEKQDLGEDALGACANH